MGLFYATQRAPAPAPAAPQPPREEVLSKRIPVLQQYLNNPDKSAMEWMERVKPPCGAKVLTAALAGLRTSGKSTLINQLVSLVANDQVQVVGQGGGVSFGSHYTVVPSRVNVLSKGRQVRGLEAPAFDLQVLDLVGVDATNSTSLSELRCALLGKARAGEHWPHEVPLSTEGRELIAAIEARVCSPLDAAHSFFFIVTPETLLNAHGDVCEALKRIQGLAKKFQPNTPPEVGIIELPVRLVITRTDCWAMAEGCTDPRCLLGGEDGFLKPLYDAARRLGFDPQIVTPIGWLDRSDIDYSNGKDPRVVVLKFLLHRMWMQSALYYQGVLDRTMHHNAAATA